jgi:hypothetical protein
MISTTKFINAARMIVERHILTDERWPEFEVVSQANQPLRIIVAEEKVDTVRKGFETFFRHHPAHPLKDTSIIVEAARPSERSVYLTVLDRHLNEGP